MQSKVLKAKNNGKADQSEQKNQESDQTERTELSPVPRRLAS
jgi:hypothetical protein